MKQHRQSIHQAAAPEGRPTNTAHLTAATRALLDHIDTHGLGYPADIEGPSGAHPGRLGVYITRKADAAAWLASIVAQGPEDNDTRTTAHDGTPYVRTVVDGTLPDTGVQVRLHVLRNLPLPLALAGGRYGTGAA